MNVKPHLLDQVREKIRLKHYSIRTEQAYVEWIKRYILFHHKRHPQEIGKQEVEQFLTHLAVDRNVAASTQNQALSAILFLYKEVLEKDIGWLENVERAKRPTRPLAGGAYLHRGARGIGSPGGTLPDDGEPALRRRLARDRSNRRRLG